MSTVTVRVRDDARGREVGRFLVPADSIANIAIQLHNFQTVMYIPGVRVPVVLTAAMRIEIEHGTEGR